MKFIHLIDLLTEIESTKKYCGVLTDRTAYEIKQTKKVIRRSQELLAQTT